MTPECVPEMSKKSTTTETHDGADSRPNGRLRPSSDFSG
jgi:hypothetical protein